MSVSLGAIARMQRIAWLALLLVCAAATLDAALCSPDHPFVLRSDAAEWITAPLPQTTNLIATRPDDPPGFTFVARFTADVAEPVRVTGRALREVEVVLNGVPLDVDARPDDWKRDFSVTSPARVQTGRNEIRVAVRNAHGPPLLRLRVEGDSGLVVQSGPDWQVVPTRGNPAPAVVARDTAVYPEARRFERPLGVLRQSGGLVLLGFVLLTGLAGWLDRKLDATVRAALPRFLLYGLTSFWVWLFFAKFVRLPLRVGFDVPAHLHYIDSILTSGRLPLAHEGFSSYHPPLFHALVAGLVGLTGVVEGDAAAGFVYRLVPFLAGLASLWISYDVARLLWPDRPVRVGLAVGVAGLLPMNLYMSAYVSNEPLHASIVGLALLLATRLILADAPDRRLGLGLGLCLGAGLLTKFTSLLVAPLIAAFVFARLWLVDQRRPLSAAAHAAALLAIAGVIAGWFYLRNWLTYGDALVWNLDIPGAATWYMQPGFHTIDYYTRFGEALSHPFFAGFASFWDGVYSTLWGDGLVAGMIRIETRHALWNYDAMVLTALLALPASVLIAGGFVRMWRCSQRESDTRKRLVANMLCLTLALLAFSLFFITLRLPFYAQARAPYILSALVPLAMAAAAGLSILPEHLTPTRHPILRALYFGWLSTLALTIAITYLT